MNAATPLPSPTHTVPADASNSLLAKRAWESLKGHWGLCIGTGAVYTAICVAMDVAMDVGVHPNASVFANLIVGGPFWFGFSILYLNIIRKGLVEFSQIFSGFREFKRSFKLNVYMNIFVLLWSILLIIPGVIAFYSYALSFFIIADDPKIDAIEALRISKKMMKGRKWKLFCLMLRFLGWILLSLVLTLGIGLLWVFPCMLAAWAHFYEDAKASEQLVKQNP